MISAPEVAESPKSWMGSEMSAAPERWTRVWTEEQIDDLTRLVEGVGDDEMTDLNPAPLSTPSLRALVDAIRDDLIHQHGFVLLKGFPFQELDRRTTAAIFLMLGRLIGTLRSQNSAGHLLGHVKDVGSDLADPGTRIYQTNERQSFHTDSTDVVGLLCIRPALSGGQSLIASAETAYRIVHQRHPDLALKLFDPIATDRRNEQPEFEKPWFEIPVLSWFDDRLTVLYQRTYIESARRFSDAPSPDMGQIKALDVFDQVLNEPDVHLAMDLEPGDIQFVYNHSVLHDRMKFMDHSDPELRRHLLRLWLSLPGDRQLPPAFAQRYGSLVVGDRGGITAEGVRHCVPLDV
jgi:alpha-ketoglutarate-dependent taurine dioxygenase